MENRKKLKQICIIFIMFITAIGCEPDTLEYKGAAANVEGKIITQLEHIGGFEHYLNCINKTEYKEILSTGKTWTVLAPTDEAFEAFFKAEGYSSVDDMPLDRILDLVQYSIFDGGWNTEGLTYYLYSTPGAAFRKRTQYKDSIVEMKAEDFPNVTNVQTGKVYNVVKEYWDPKTVVYFQPYYMERVGLKKSDYEFMFSGTTYSEGDELRVFEANAVEPNIVAGNGFIHGIDKVIEPEENLYENLMSDEYQGRYSMFKNLVDRFAYFRSNGLGENTGEREETFMLRFNTGIGNNYLPFNPNDEGNFWDFYHIRAQIYAFAITVPTNEALIEYLNGDSVLAQAYASYDEMPDDVLAMFLGNHFFSDYLNLCPSRQGNTFNILYNSVDYSPGDAVDIKFCSNGLFVGVNKVYTPNDYGSVLGPLLLDPKYKVMLDAIKGSDIIEELRDRNTSYSVFGLANDQFVNIPDPKYNRSTRRITIVDASTTGDFSQYQMQVTGDTIEANNRLYPEDVGYVEETLAAIVQNQIVEEQVQLNSGDYYQTKSGDFVKALTDGTMAGQGDLLADDKVNIVSTRETINGNFYTTDKHFQRPIDYAYKVLETHANKFSRFIELLEAADAFIDITSDDKRLGMALLSKHYTLLAPNNTAIEKAISDGVIVDPNNLPTDTEELAVAKEQLLNFAKLHMLQDSFFIDVAHSTTVESLYYSEMLDYAPLYKKFKIESSSNKLVIKNTDTGENITLTGELTNLFSKGVVIHELDDYLN